ncbi:MAG: DUF2206 domain-containing protein [Candidatus Bathyarchaeia archaeon]
MLQVSWRQKYMFVTLLMLQFILNISIFLDVLVVRQFLGFLYLVFVPGFLILKMLKLEKLNFGEIISFSVGLSVAFLMFFGLVLNELLPLVGIVRPLATELLIIGLNPFIVLLCLVLYHRERASKNAILRFPFFDLAVWLALSCLPVLSVAGSIIMNANEDNFLLLLIMILISVCFLAVLALRKKFTLDVFSVTLLMMYVAVLITLWLTTNYVLGYDSQSEFYAFQITRNAALWNPVKTFDLERDKAIGTLSVTVLPTIYSNIMSLDATWIIKIVYPLLASFVPLGLYQFYLLHTKKEAAFLGVFLFIIHSLGGLGSLKEWIATIFYILLFYVILTDKIPSSKKRILFIIFAGALIVSHYAKSYIFLFILTFMWAALFISRKNAKVTLNMVLMFLCMAFAWSIFTMHATTFEDLIRTLDNIRRNLISEFFNPESRGSDVMMATGLLPPPTYLHVISRLIFYLTVLLIVIGFISLTMKFWKRRTSFEYTLLVFLNMGLLALAVIVPNLAESFKMGRFYRTALTILAPLCVFGGEEIVASLHKLKIPSVQKKFSAVVLVSIVLVFHFLFQTETVYEVAKVESWSISLSRYRMPPQTVSEILLYETDVAGAIWLSQKCSNSSIYSDYASKFNVLTSYGLIDYKRLYTLTNTTITIEAGNFIYLRRLNTIHEIMTGYFSWNTTNLKPLFDVQNIIYSNGDCHIYQGIGN